MLFLIESRLDSKSGYVVTGINLFRGEITDITIVGDQTTNVGTVQADVFIPTLIVPAADSSHISAFDFLWSPIQATIGSITYRIQVSGTSDFAVPLIDEIALESSFSYAPETENLPNDTELFWRVRTFDSMGGLGTWSEPWSFVLMIMPEINVQYEQYNVPSSEFIPTLSGQYAATVRIENDDTDESPYAFIIQARVTDQPLSAIAVRQEALLLTDDTGTRAFANVVADGDAGIYTGEWITFTIESTGLAPLTISNITLSNVDDSDLDAALPKTIPSGGSDTFSIRFDLLTQGDRSSSVVIHNNASDDDTYTFSISGTGTAYEPVITFRQGSQSLPNGIGVYDFNVDGRGVRGCLRTPK